VCSLVLFFLLLFLSFARLLVSALLLVFGSLERFGFACFFIRLDVCCFSFAGFVVFTVGGFVFRFFPVLLYFVKVFLLVLSLCFHFL